MTILIPIDFSLNALKAARYALTHYRDANFIFLHVINIRQAGAILTVDINRDLQEVYQKQMTETIAQLKQEFSSVKMQGSVEIGMFSETVQQAIENDKIDLLVLGTNGASRIDELLLGSNAYLAIKNATIPLLIINPAQTISAPKKILFASDFEGTLSDNVVQPVIDFKNRFDADMHVIHINRKGDGSDVKVRINELIEKEVKHFHIVNSGNIENAVCDFAKKEAFDFVVLAPKYRGLIKEIFHASIAKKISALGKTSLFILK